MKSTIVRLVLLACALGLILLSEAAASGSPESVARMGIPSARGIYSGCYQQLSGALRLVPGWKHCRAGEERVTWNHQGQPGLAGPQGDTGARGPTGERGSPGSNGPQGPQGTAGTQGPAGAQGNVGPIGPAGSDGVDGAPGPQGAPGADGIDGVDGAPGAPGAMGMQGPVGPQGPAGPLGSQLMVGTPVTSVANAARNVTVTSTASCAAGKVLMGGGGLVTTTVAQKERAYLVASYPSAATQWMAIGVVGIAALGSGQTMTVTAYALCSL